MQQDATQAPAIVGEAVRPVTLPVTYRLPAAPPAAIRQEAQQRTTGLQQIAPPPMPRDPFQTPSAELWPSNTPVRMNLVGVKFGWEL